MIKSTQTVKMSFPIVVLLLSLIMVLSTTHTDVNFKNLLPKSTQVTNKSTDNKHVTDNLQLISNSIGNALLKGQ